MKKITAAVACILTIASGQATQVEPMVGTDTGTLTHEGVKLQLWIPGGTRGSATPGTGWSIEYTVDNTREPLYSVWTIVRTIGATLPRTDQDDEVEDRRGDTPEARSEQDRQRVWVAREMLLMWYQQENPGWTGRRTTTKTLKAELITKQMKRIGRVHWQGEPQLSVEEPRKTAIEYICDAGPKCPTRMRYSRNSISVGCKYEPGKGRPVWFWMRFRVVQIQVPPVTRTRITHVGRIVLEWWIENT
jgi:hypothetical protein